MSYDYDKWLRQKYLPTQWCPGCGDGMVLKAMIQAFDANGWTKDNTCVVSGIGCSGRISSYFDCDTLHTTHGRALAYATGLKFPDEEGNVVVVSGDGDGTAIGGNHFIHACRRNIDLKYIIINNFIYGLTNSQASPTTPQGMWAVTQQEGAIDPTFNICDLAIAAGATFVARGTTGKLPDLVKLLTASFAHKGFSVVEVFSGCPVNFGRHNKMGTPEKIDDWIASIALSKAAYEKLSEEEKVGKFQIGILKQDTTQLDYGARYRQLCESLQESEVS